MGRCALLVVIGVASVAGDVERQLTQLLRKARLLDMPALREAFPGRSQRSIMRDLVAVGYLASCNLSGRFYTLADVPDFDADGLWRHGPALFSRHGTLKATVCQLVGDADNGRTHPELQQRLQLRVHNTLFELVEQGQLGRERLDQLFLYVSADGQVRAAQVTKRRSQLAPDQPPPLGPEVVSAVLVAVIQREARGPEGVMAHLHAQGRPVTLEQVAQIFERYDLAKKKSRWPP